MTEKTEQSPALQAAIEAIKKVHGKGAILQDNESVPGVEFTSSQCPSLDRVLGGGWPKGRMIEIFGPESSGKTTLALHAVAQQQIEGRTCAFIDMEHALDPMYAKALGVDVNSLLISQPDNGEQALDIIEVLLKSGEVGLIVLDSVAALVPRAEIEGNAGDSHMGLQARLMSQAMRKLSGAAHRTNTTVMWINQIRMKIGVMFGSPETVSGGNALKFYASQRIDIRRIGGVKAPGKDQADDTIFIANRTRAKIVKNKVAPPFRQTEFDIVYGLGINIVGDLLDLAVLRKVIEKAGSWYSYNEEQLGQGREKTIVFLKEHPEVLEEIKGKLNG